MSLSPTISLFCWIIDEMSFMWKKPSEKEEKKFANILFKEIKKNLLQKRKVKYEDLMVRLEKDIKFSIPIKNGVGTYDI